VTPIFTVLPNLIINRLVLNLRSFPEPGQTTSLKTNVQLTVPVFATNQILGNIGAPLDLASWMSEVDEEDEEVHSHAIVENDGEIEMMSRDSV